MPLLTLPPPALRAAMESPGRDPVHITALLHYTESGVFETLVITHKHRNNRSTPSTSSGRYPVCRLLFPLPYLLTTSAENGMPV